MKMTEKNCNENHTKNMNVIRIIESIIIYLVLPSLGIYSYILLIRKMKREKINNLPTLEYLILYFTYGGLLTVLLTSIFSIWSGLASIGTLYLLLLAPIILAYNSYKMFKKRSESKYHKMAFILSALYFLIVPTIVVLIYLNEPEWIH